MKVTDEYALSDHKPVTLNLRNPMSAKKRPIKHVPTINWEVLSGTENLVQYKKETKELHQKFLTDESSWTDVAKVLTTAATKVCGLGKKEETDSEPMDDRSRTGAGRFSQPH